MSDYTDVFTGSFEKYWSHSSIKLCFRKDKIDLEQLMKFEDNGWVSYSRVWRYAIVIRWMILNNFPIILIKDMLGEIYQSEIYRKNIEFDIMRYFH